MSFLTAGAKIVEGVSAGLYAAGTMVMQESQTLVPVDTGTLKRSGMVEQPVAEADSVSVTVGYGYGEEVNPKTGQPATGYAIFVHERLDAQHAPPTQAKFLEQPARGFESRLGPTIREAVLARLGPGKLTAL